MPYPQGLLRRLEAEVALIRVNDFLSRGCNDFVVDEATAVKIPGSAVSG